METLDGRVAVITGAASGIGLAVASRCASEGMKLVTTASIAALIHPPQMGAYNASKAAVFALTEPRPPVL